jgi:hypothetical protein
MEHKMIISGTGRAGTTMLVQLLTQLGLDTGFRAAGEKVDPRACAGMEWQLDDPAAPYIIKSPWLCLTLERHLKSGHFVIDHALLPMRDLKAAAASRIAVSLAAERESAVPMGALNEVPGGLWCTRDPSRQAAVLARLFHKLVHVLTEYEIPHTFLDFPRFAQDPVYLERKLTPILPDQPGERFREAFRRVARPELIGNFRITKETAGGL